MWPLLLLVVRPLVGASVWIMNSGYVQVFLFAFLLALELGSVFVLVLFTLYRFISPSSVTLAIPTSLPLAFSYRDSWAFLLALHFFIHVLSLVSS